MKFLDWVKDFFGVDQSTVYLNQQAIATQETQLAIETFAISSAVNLISSAVSKCEFKTYLNGKELKGDEYYLWNVEPNKNQNSSQFIQELVSKLLYNNECLVIEVNGQLIVADSFYQNEYATLENSFVNVAKGTMSFNKTFRMSEVLYFKLGNDDIRVLLSNLLKGYNSLLNMAIGKYRRSGGRKGILDIDSTATGNPEYQKRFDDLMNNRFKKYFEAENAVLPLHKGFNYEEQNGEGSKKSTSEMVDISSITKEAFERVAQAFRMPPALLRGDIADIGKLTDNFLTFCIDPIVDMISEEANRKRFGKNAFLKGSYLKVDTTCIKHSDIFSISEAFDKLVASGGYSIDELRIKVGDTPLNMPWSRKHWMTKNYQDIENLKGGENIE
ncbi:phage portal protein [Clostridium sp. CX1]|uniref:phage portal protein n=1 Tax=Clostridium sp. CX1 TaxID=2978346 RepID=UPI0021C1480E|nr:phage portal protein [Clostridium sp. CX1]MCT8978661.1 phage portal protein [Clostridium sp. CX1]